MKRASASPALTAAPLTSARQAGLRYVLDDQPGITRSRRGKGFVYHMPKGAPLRNAQTQRRIRSLVIPPAWTDVWICPLPNGHIQATGRDARRRKQYRYHPRWQAVRDVSKYERMLAFGAVLPRIRRRVSVDLRSRGFTRQKIMATIVRLLETTLIRVGNDEYAQKNGSYGLTTLQNNHARVKGSQITFSFKGKSGMRHQIGLRDPRLAKLVRRCQELPGQHLFGYLDDAGKVHEVTSDNVNAYLREIAGAEFSAKDFRTWAGTILTAIALRELANFNSPTEARRNITQAVKAVAKILGNTAAVCRRCYIHPAILSHYTSGRTIPARQEQRLLHPSTKLSPDEMAVMALLRAPKS
ncbi:DNA topoisomerase IB [Prosthecobacter sp.]|uniref:DNA topoisomerase IB n=1 Tax=Prosthecobacter sp. TaxID=1965333 RepID=UPI00378406E1